MTPNRSLQWIWMMIGPALMLALVASSAHAQTLPAISVQQGQLVSPETAIASYPSTTTHTRDLPSVQADALANIRRPEIRELARGLGASLVVAGQLTQAAYADRVYEYVRQNVAVDFMYGLQKGALGALIDQRGTPFDQAQLMVELLREAQITASYQIGTITISGAAAFGNWTGATDALSACRLLADGGIPGKVNGVAPANCSVSGALTTVEMRHIWVSAVSKLFDPSYKQHTWKTGIDLASAMSCGTAAAPTCYTSLLSALQTGASSGSTAGVPFTQTLNKGALDNQLRQFATNLQNTLQLSQPSALIDDIAGGKSIDPTLFVPAGATLPYSTSSTTTWTDDVPDQYRTRLTVQFDSINRTLFADETYGKRLHLLGQLSAVAANQLTATRRVSLYVDYELIAASTRTGGTVDNSILTVSANHPYLASSGAYSDQTVSNTVGQTLIDHSIGGNETFFSPTTIVQGWGGAGSGTVNHFTKLKEHDDHVLPLKDPFALGHYWECIGAMPWAGEDIPFIEPGVFIVPPATSINMPASPRNATLSPTCHQQEQPVLLANWFAQVSTAADLIGRVNASLVTFHHTIGSAASYRFGSSLNVSSSVGIVSLRNDASDRKAAAFSLSAVSSHLEANTIQQGDDAWETWSSVSAWVRANEQNAVFILVTSANLAQAATQVIGYTAEEWSRVQSYVGSGHAVLLPKQAVVRSWTTVTLGVRTIRDAVFAFKPAGDSLAHVLAGTKGARTTSVVDPTATIYASARQSDASLKARRYFGVDLSQGAVTLTPAPDLVTGSGEFPNSLSFQRLYSSASTDLACTPKAFWSACSVFERIAGNWDFSLNIRATMGSDAFQAMGQDSALDAAGSLAVVFALRDASRGITDEASGFNRNLLSAFATYWWGSELINNSVVVRRPPSSATFMRLPNGTFNAPPSSAEQVVQTGSRAVPDPVAVLAQHYYDYQPVSFNLTDKDGSVLALRTPRAMVSAQPIDRLREFVPATWTFPTGVALTFEYTLSPFPAVFPLPYLTGIRNNLGRRLNLPNAPLMGEMTTATLSVSDENGRAVQVESVYGAPPIPFGSFGSLEVKVTTPDTKINRYTYQLTADVALPRVASVVNAWFTPTDTSTSPFVQLQYDPLMRVSSISTAPNNAAGLRSVSNYFIGSLRLDENIRRGERRDPLNAVTTSYFGKLSEELQTIDPLERVTTKTYDSRRRLKRVISPEAHVDAAGNPRTPAGDWVEYSYDARHNVVETRKKAKQGSARPDIVTTALYPACTAANQYSCNRPSSTTDASGRTTTYLYYSDGQVRRVTGPALTGGGNARTDYCYSQPAGTQFRLLSGKIGVVGGGKPDRVVSYAYDSANKYVLSSAVTDPSTTLIAAASDSVPCTTSTKAGALNLATALTFDTAGNVNTINGPRPDSPVADVTTYAFDSMRRLRQIDGPSGTNAKTVYDYYDDGTLRTVDRQEMVGGSPVMRRETRVYWPSGDLFTITDPENNLTQFDYDRTGRVSLITDPDGRRVGTVYDAVGQTACTWKGWNNTTAPASCTWDPATYVSAGNNGPLRYAEYAYTLNGKPRLVTDADNNVTEYVYDNHDNPRYTFFPNASNGARCTLPSALPGGVESGTPSCPASGGTTPTYEDLWYTVNGTPAGTLCSGDVRVCRKRTRAAQTITNTYDELNRLATKAATSLPTVTYTYTLLSEPLTAVSPVSGSIPAHGVRYDYDDAGRKNFEENLINGAYRRVAYGYDQAGNRTSTTWPDSYLVSYEYDVLNRMSKVWEGAPTTGFKLADYTYDSLSRRQSLRFAGSAANETTHTYELDSQLDVLTHTLTGTQSFNLNYDHNGSGQIKGIVASDDFFLPMPATPPTPYAPNRLNQYGSIGGQVSTYDSNGNLTTWFPTGGKHTYTYDSENRLRTAAINGGTTPTITYDYDTLGRRLTKNNNGTRTGYLLDGDEEIAEYSVDASDVWASTPLRRYVMGSAVDDRVAAIDVGTATRTYYHVNHQGSVLAMTNATGDATCATCQRLSYDEYGFLGGGSPSGQPYRYTGRRFDEETGLYYYRARYYTPVLGRFLQADPIGHEDDFNLYTYTRNDPLNRFDPNGEDSFTVARRLDSGLAARAGFGHAYVVSNARYVGDPKATVHSYGKLQNGNMGNVGDTNKAADVSKTTAATDATHWKSLNASATANVSTIDAPDKVVAAVAGAVNESKPYSLTPSESAGSPARGLGVVSTPEVNSNSAAFAVGDRAEQISTGDPNARLNRQPFDLTLPGASASKKVEFNCTKDLNGVRGC